MTMADRLSFEAKNPGKFIFDLISVLEAAGAKVDYDVVDLGRRGTVLCADAILPASGLNPQYKARIKKMLSYIDYHLYNQADWESWKQEANKQLAAMR